MITQRLHTELDQAGLHASFLVRDLNTGHEIGINPDTPYATASLVKIPLALATLQRIHQGELDGATPLHIKPDGPTLGPTGLGRFRHPASIAIDDLLHLAMSLSDNIAADALFDLTPPAHVTQTLHQHHIHGITVRHRIRDLNETPAERLAPDETHLAHTLAIQAQTAGHGHRIPQLDVTLANSGTARAHVDLLQALWKPTTIHPDTAARLRALMADNLIRHRLAPEFDTDASTWSSKTGTVLNHRHEVGVVEHKSGEAYAIAALTASQVPARQQPAAEALIGRAARILRDHLRAN
ncbi:class A beta-lactamase-related serine hydrolase [Nocardiopsis exhalans]|uniref:Beta-lactamase class A n=2 Tax=Nocardiopsis TaxID=2013 RepID=A0A840WDG5_9ACTN|nr:MULTISPECIES: serine hydrolase [Nocardiopsis]MBB5489336.1 beta-lactamase class A [Nocardiopsis metallicus]USY22238.1 class A beta-lactamase-related serine hydrolase [Nocardiopsis exhalans]